MGSAEEGHAQAPALAWLGVWEAEEGADPATARELFQAALALDPKEPTAGAAPGAHASVRACAYFVHVDIVIVPHVRTCAPGRNASG